MYGQVDPRRCTVYGVYGRWCTVPVYGRSTAGGVRYLTVPSNKVNQAIRYLTVLSYIYKGKPGRMVPYGIYRLR